MEVLNFSIKRGQNEIHSDFAEREKIQGLKNLNVPNLRFGEYSDEWSLTELQKVATISKGSGISKDQLSENGTYCILYGELYTKYNSEIISEVYSKTELDAANLVKSKENDVIIPCSGETAIDISTARCVPFNGILLGGDLNIIRLKNQNGGFFAYQLNGKRKVDIAKVAQGVSVVHLYGEHLKQVKIAYPTYSEQKKIADFLSLLDSRIATQNKIIQQLQSLIKGIYDKVFEDISDYQKLSSVCTIQKGQQVNGEELSELGDYYVMNGGIEPSGYYDRYNTYANTISISEGGNSCGYVQYNNVPFWSGGHCYTLQNIKEGYHNLFLYHYLKAREKEIMALRIGSGLPNIQKKDLEKFIVPILPLETQVGIVDGINKIETKLKQEKDILSAYQKQKAYLLRNLFI